MTDIFKNKLYNILGKLKEISREEVFMDCIQYKLDQSLSSYSDNLEESCQYLGERQSIYALRKIAKGLKEVRNE